MTNTPPITVVVMMPYAAMITLPNMIFAIASFHVHLRVASVIFVASSIDILGNITKSIFKKLWQPNK